MKPVPKSVLSLIGAAEWQANAFRTFEERFRDRGADPCYYVFHKGGDDANVGGADMTFDEAKALHQEAVFASLSRDDGNALVVNEHAVHAVQDLCRDVYEAWRKYEARIAEVSRVSGLLRVEQ